MRSLALGLALVGCTPKHKPPTVLGSDLYAHVGELRAGGVALVPAGRQQVPVRASQFLVDTSRDQVFVVEQIIANCHGGGLAADADCALALVPDQRFVVTDTPPKPREPDDDDERDGLSPRTKGLLIALALAGPLTYGAWKCDFEGCEGLFGVALGLDATALLLLLIPFR